MRRPCRIALVVVALACCARPAAGQSDAAGSVFPSGFRLGPSDFTWGGSIGFGFGSVNWVSVAPQLGYFASDRLWTGVSAKFQFTNDTRYDPDFNSTNFGFGVFGRYLLFDRAFGEVEWSWYSYQVRLVNAQTSRTSLSSVYVGGGYAQPFASSAAVVLEMLYDVTGNAATLYGNNWLLRLGVAAGF